MIEEGETGLQGRLADRPYETSQRRPSFSQNLTVRTLFDFENVTVLVVRITPDCKFWVVGLLNGSIKLIPVTELDTNSVITLRVKDETSPCVDLQCVPQQSYFSSEKNHRLVAVYASGFVRIWYYTGATIDSCLLSTFTEEYIHRPEELAPLTQRKTNNQLLACSCSYDSERCVTGGDDCNIRVYDLNELRCVRTCCFSFSADKVDGHVMRICALKYHPRGSENTDFAHLFVSGGWDDTIHIWDDRLPHALWTYAGPHIAGSDALDIEPQSNDILSCSWRHDSSILQVWKFNEQVITLARSKLSTSEEQSSIADNVRQEMGDIVREKPILEVPQESIEMRSKGYVAKWIGHNYFAFGGSDVNTLKILSRTRHRVLATVSDLPGGVFSLDYIRNSEDELKKNTQIAFSSGSKVFLVSLDPK